MFEVGQALRGADVAAIYLAHGTFVGTDAWGVLAEFGRMFPAAEPALRRVIKRLVDNFLADVGNFTGAYAQLFEQSLAEPTIPVRRFHWSSENHHIGRADGAVRLIDELARLDLAAGQRVLLWGHSHAGNVFALATNLLGGARDAVEEFFSAAEVYYRWPLLGWVDIPLWQRVRDLLRDEHHRLRDIKLDFVTFGTPIRYGWETAGYSQLLHFIYHRPVPGLAQHRAPFPLQLERVLDGRDGDYIQQLGIAGTNLMPSIFAWRTWWADNRLDALLQGDLRQRDLAERFRVGARVPDEGTTLLVDYGPLTGDVSKHHAGHALYTRTAWLPFHATEVAHRFYNSTSFLPHETNPSATGA